MVLHSNSPSVAGLVSFVYVDEHFETPTLPCYLRLDWELRMQLLPLAKFLHTFSSHPCRLTIRLRTCIG